SFESSAASTASFSTDFWIERADCDRAVSPSLTERRVFARVLLFFFMPATLDACFELIPYFS
ncbi:hypothetical protein, partial [Reyranella sp.]|uniref:hypothetical protein n=1 Tax=Reyranella sp. TaxID=1929291 RepID=UPI003F6F6EF6